MRRVALGVGLIGAVALLGTVDGCGSDDELTVLAASSLTSAFTDLAERYEQDHTGTEVRLVFAGSSQLANQILEGADADVFASASADQIDRLDLRTDRAPAVFARNTLVVGLAPGNPAEVTDFASLAEPGLRLAACVADVPCGTLAAEVLASAEADIEIDSFEPNVRAVLTKLTLGEIDAGFVYRSDVLDAGIDSIELPVTATTSYPIVALDPEGAAFVELVVGEEGQAVLAGHGFEAP